MYTFAELKSLLLLAPNCSVFLSVLRLLQYHP